MLRHYSKLKQIYFTFFQAGANWRLKYFSGPPDGRCRRQIVSITFFLHRKTQKREVFQDDFRQENIPTPERLQESDSTCKGIKISCS